MDMAFCMAGTYRRFREAGYTTPKYLLPAGDGRTVLGRILDGLLDRVAVGRVCFVANRRDERHVPAIHAELVKRDIAKRALRLIGDTAGQADSAIEACNLLDDLGSHGDRPVAFHNVDTILEGRDLSLVSHTLGTAAGWIDTFTSASPAFSYVAAGPDGRVRAIVEKRVISDCATTGLYAFSSRAHFRRCAWGPWAPTGEHYISSVYQRMLDHGDIVIAGRAGPATKTLVLGTPAEYEAHLATLR